MLNLNYEYKLKLNKEQTSKVEFTLEGCRKVYNYALRERKDWINSRKCPINSCSLSREYIIPADAPYPNYNYQAKNLTQYRKDSEELKQIHSQVLQQTLKTLDRAFEDMRKNGKGFPRFKKKMHSFLFPQLSADCLGCGRIKLPSFGWVNIVQSRPFPEGFIPKQCRIVKKASGYYVIITFQSDVSVPDPVHGTTSIGVDANISNFLATSQGDIVDAPKFLDQYLRKIKLLQRRLKHKVKGSKNWQKLQRKIARLYEKVANTRKDWHFKLSHWLCRKADNVFIEDINYKAWGRGIFRKKSLDYSCGAFFNQILPYVAWKTDTFFLKVDKDFSSQECPRCHNRTGKKSLSERTHKCPHCGYTVQRDVASSIVIQQRGEMAVGLPVTKIAFGGDATGGVQLSLFDSSSYSLVGTR